MRRTVLIVLLALGCAEDPGPDVPPLPPPSFPGEAPDLTTRLAVFDDLADDLTAKWVFAASDVDWDTLRAGLRLRMADADSYGEFYRVLTDLSLELRDYHNVVYSRAVCSTPLAERPALLRGFAGRSHYGPGELGFCGTALDDGTVLVYSAEFDNPAGLRPGDQIVGFDGTALRVLLERALGELPVCGFHAAHPKSHDALLMTAMPYNVHLYDQIDILRFDTQETESIATDDLLGFEFPDLLCTDQMATNVPFPWYGFSEVGQGSAISSGILAGTSVGYIYGYSWSGDAESALLEAVTDLADTDGLIIDFRMNFGGNMFLSFPTLQLLFDRDVAGVFHVGTRANATDLDAVTFFSEAYKVTVDPATSYDRPIALLTGPLAVSSGDDVAYMIAHHPRARRFGRPTNGSGCFNPGGGTLWDRDPHVGDLTIVRTTCVSFDRFLTPFSGVAVEPEAEVWLAPEDVANGRDTVVEAALAWIAAENTGD